MSRLKIKLILPIFAALLLADRALTSDLEDWYDVSPADRIDHYPINPYGWSRFDDGPFIRRAIKNRLNAHRSPSIARNFQARDNVNDSPTVRRVKRENSPDSKMEKISGMKSVREARVIGSPESWSKQPLSVQFRPRSHLDELAPEHFEESSDKEEISNLTPLIRRHYAPKTDFITSGRSRDGLTTDIRPPLYEGRESRDMPIARSYDEYDVPIFRNIVREHDFDIELPRNYYSPNRYRSQREYYYGRNGTPNPYGYDRYRGEDDDYETLPRYRSTPKPKRIIYYATLPEVVRKPVDLRTYQRPYDPYVRSPEAQIDMERDRLLPNNIEPSKRPLRYSYDYFDNYVKRSSYNDRRRPPYAAGEEDRLRAQERSRAGYRDKLRNDDRRYDSQLGRTGDDRRPPWPLQIGTEVNVKANERIPGRKIFGQTDGFERYEGARMKKISINAERKEDTNQESKDSNHNISENSNDNNN